MNDMAESIIIDSLSKAAARVRATMFINLTLCAVVFSNLYLQYFSFTNKQMQSMHELAVVFERQMEDICIIYVESSQYEGDKCINNIINKDQWEPGDISEFSALFSRKAFAENSLENFQMPKAEIPFIGISVYINDLNLVCGLFMLIVSIWLLFSANQIDDTIKDLHSESIIEKYAHEIIHIFSTMYIKQHSGLRFITLLTLFAPGTVMLLAILGDIFSILSYDVRKVFESMLSHVLVSVALMAFITGALFWSAKEVWSKWSDLLNELRGKAIRQQEKLVPPKG